MCAAGHSGNLGVFLRHLPPRTTGNPGFFSRENCVIFVSNLHKIYTKCTKIVHKLRAEFKQIFRVILSDKINAYKGEFEVHEFTILCTKV